MSVRTVDVAVVGAGAFGGWTALMLRRAGLEVALVDAWGPGNSRASSGGETRVIRGIYGGVAEYVRMVARAFTLWQDHEDRTGQRFYRRTGALWFFGEDDTYARSTLSLLTEAGLRAVELRVDEAARQYPQVAFTGVRTVFFEPEAGYLLARRACHSVRDTFVAEGGQWVLAHVAPGEIHSGRMDTLRLGDGTTLAADRFVFACGPWLGLMFPELLGHLIRPTRQEVFLFGAPPGDHRFDADHLPVWLDFSERMIYGIPGNDYRGFKVADDTRGDTVDPTSLERITTTEGLARVRALLRRRFPSLRDAPVVQAKVCQYENTPDSHLILDRHPAADNVWIAGGGSGHGFKLGPAVGEHVAALVTGQAAPMARFRLDRFPRR